MPNPTSFYDSPERVKLFSFAIGMFPQIYHQHDKQKPLCLVYVSYMFFVLYCHYKRYQL